MPLTRPAAPSDLSHEGRGENANGALTPQALAAARLESRTRPNSIAPNTRLCAASNGSTPGSMRARDLGFVAIDTETSSLDPMQAELCGFSLAVAPNEACYVPLSHRHGGEGGKDSLFAGEIARRSD